MSVPGLYEPSAVQLEAHSFQPFDEVEILYGGTAGSGKTLFLRWDPFETQWAGEHQRWVDARSRGEQFQSVGWALHVRRVFPMLIQTILYVRDVSGRLDPGVKWDGDNYLLTFSCGYRYQFGHVQNEEDWRKYDSQDYTHLSVDEAVQTLKVQYDMLWARVRTTDPILGKKLRTCLASNPDAPFEGLWVKERFVDPAPSGRKTMIETRVLSNGKERTTARVYIPARLSDNPDVDYRERYEAKLRQLPHHIMMARLFGDWNAVEGAFFEYEWKPDVHVVEPYQIPKHWPRIRIMDWGYKSPCPVVYAAVDEEGNYIVYEELNFNHKVRDDERKDAELVAIAIKKHEKAHDEADAKHTDVRYWDDGSNSSRITGPADYQIRERRGTIGPTIEETMAQYGIYWNPCTKDRKAATAELLRRLKDIPKSKHSRPGITVFNTCKEICRTMPLIERDKNDPEVPKDGGDDHWLDCLFYLVMNRDGAAEKPKNRWDDEDEDNELAMARAKRANGKWGYGL